MLHTNICVALIRGRSARLVDRLRTCSAQEVGISSITLAELQVGVAKSDRPEKNAVALLEFSAPFVIPVFDYGAARQYGPLRAKLERIGSVIGPLDMLIAAHAMSLSATMVTNNVREFRRVAGLNVENWLAS